MSGTYINNDGRSEALNNAATHEKGLYDPNTHDNQIVALYETMAEANKARDMLVHAGVSSDSIQVMDKSSDTMAGGVDYESGHQGMWGALKSLFIPDDEAHGYNHAINAGHAMVVVSPAATANREVIIHTLEGSNPVDFDAKLEEWRQSGYDYGSMGTAAAGATASTTVNRAAATPANYAVNQTTMTDNIPASAGTGIPASAGTGIPASAGMASTAATMGASATTAMAGTTTTGAAAARSGMPVGGDTDTIKVMEERLRVGKREVAAGAVRVRSYVVERPVEEQVRLHEERVQIERHPVDRAVTAADAAAAFQDRTIEAKAMSEEAIVGKDVRVVEEIGIRKEASDRTETVRDTVRKTEVEVEDSSTAVHPGTGKSSVTGGTGMADTSPAASNSTPGATTSGMNAPRK